MSSDKDKQLSVGCEISINMRAFTRTTSRTHTDQLPNGCIVGHSKLDDLNLITNGMNWQVVVMYLSQMAAQIHNYRPKMEEDALFRLRLCSNDLNQ